MANIDFAAIRARIREVLDDGAGLVRTVSAGRLAGDYWDGADEWAGAARTLEKPRFDIRSCRITKSTASPLEPGSLKIEVLTVEIVCEYNLANAVDTDANRDAAIATAEQDADVIEQAFHWLGNLDEATTGIINGVLSRDGEMQVLETNYENRRLRTLHRYRGHVRVTQAVS